MNIETKMKEERRKLKTVSDMPIEIQPSVLCDECSNVGKGVALPGRKICLSCASDDPELLAEICRVAMPEFSSKYDAILKQAGGIK